MVAGLSLGDAFHGVLPQRRDVADALLQVGHLADAGAPTLIRKDENSPALYVLMPMRV